MRPGPRDVHGSHHGSRERRDADRHSDSEHDHGWEEGRPVATADAREHEEPVAGRRDEPTDDERRHYTRWNQTGISYV